MKAYRGNRPFRQFLASQDNNSDSDDDESNIAKALEDVKAYIISVKVTSHDDNDDDELKGFSHMATVLDEDYSVSFIAQPQNAAFTLAPKPALPQRFGNIFKGIMVDIGAARGSTAGRLQYFSYCKNFGIEPSIDERRATKCHFGIRSTH